MKLQPASKKELRRIAIGTGICDLILLIALFILSLEGIGSFNYTVILGTAGGSLVAILNFTIMCLTVQRAVDISEQKQMKAFIQGSHNGRLLLQAGWIVVAFLIPHFNVIAAALPLLFPSLTIFCLQSKGKPVAPGNRMNPPTDDHLGSFEV